MLEELASTFPILTCILFLPVIGAVVLWLFDDEDMVRTVMRMGDANEYKRRQTPPGPKITSKAFGRDRRLPITNRYRES